MNDEYKTKVYYHPSYCCSLTMFWTAKSLAIKIIIIRTLVKKNNLKREKLKNIYLLCFLSHLSGLVGILLPNKQEAAYSVLRMVSAVGFTIGFLFAIFLESQIQLWVAIGLIIIMFLTYTILIFKMRHRIV